MLTILTFIVAVVILVFTVVMPLINGAAHEAKRRSDSDLPPYALPKGKMAAGVVMAFAVMFSTAAWYINSEYEKSVITRLGEFQRVTGPGLQFKNPFLEDRAVADTRIDSISIPRIEIATKGGANVVYFDMTVNHRINATTDEALRSLYKQFGENFDYESRLFSKLSVDRLKGIVSQYPIEEVVEKRGEIRSAILDSVNQAAAIYDIIVVDVQLENLDYGDDYKSRLAEVSAERAKAAAAEQQERQSEFVANAAENKADGEARAKVKAADAAAYQVRVQAEAEAEKIRLESIETAAAIKREGEAKADALRAQAEALRSSPELVALTKAEAMKKWDGSSVPQIIMNGDGGTTPGLYPFLNAGDMLKSDKQP